MNTKKTLTPSESTLDVVTTPSTLPPSPGSGVFLRAAPARSESSAPTAAPPCATFWPRAELAATLRASEVLSVAADEIDWVHENMDDESDPVCIQARATIEHWLAELSPEHQAVIALHHDPMPWPEELPGHEEDSFALVLYLLCPSTRRDLRISTPEQLLRRARRRVDIGIEREGNRALQSYVRRARWVFEEAVCAYAEVRGRVASVVPEGASDFDAEVDL